LNEIKKPFYKKTDIIIISIIVFISLISWASFNLFTSNDHLFAEIYLDNQLVKKIDLSTAQNGTFSVAGRLDVIFEIKDGAIRFYESSCPDKICIRAGFLSRSNQSAACLPNKMVLKIVSNTETDDPDFIVK